MKKKVGDGCVSEVHAMWKRMGGTASEVARDLHDTLSGVAEVPPMAALNISGVRVRDRESCYQISVITALFVKRTKVVDHLLCGIV